MILTSIDDLPKLDKLTNGIAGYLNYRYDEKQEPSGLSSGDTCSWICLTLRYKQEGEII